ncbi:MAG: hypothetical protein IT373_10300 [Polyangiaceae bacterium]|nr:hypothetical protein [Polyangiaceae bacterium]
MRSLATLVLLAAACTQPALAPDEPHDSAPAQAATAKTAPAELKPAPAVPPAPACDPLSPEPFPVTASSEDPPLVPIADGDRLAPFYRKVAALLRGRARDHIRIAVYGDSNLIMDYQTGQLRRRLQGRFGDAGHGYVSVAKPWWAYHHMDVGHGSRGWTPYAVSTDPAPDRYYGLAGLTAESLGTTSPAWAETAPAGAPIGRTADTFEVYYLERDHPAFELALDGRVLAEVAKKTDGKLGVARVETDDAAHRLEVRPRGNVRVFGIALERRASPPSFVVDSFGVGALNSRVQAMKDPDLEAAMLRQRAYDLVVFHTGHNDGFTHRETPAAMASILALHRRALPDAPILILTPADRGDTDTFVFTRIAVEQRRALAAEHETALWDLWQAMGGRRSMSRFKHRRLALSDFTHFNEPGGAWVGDHLLEALWRDLARYLALHPDAGCEPAEASASAAR